jgi:hypothetical protein
MSHQYPSGVAQIVFKPLGSFPSEFAYIWTFPITNLTQNNLPFETFAILSESVFQDPYDKLPQS